MNLHSIECFLALVDTMNFTKAADQLHITQQTLSGNIKRLEDFYDTKFFERKPRLMLTPAGRCMLDYAKKVIKHEEYFISELADITNTTTAKLHIGFTGMRSSIFMPKIWEKFHRNFPNITLSIKEASTEELDEFLYDGELELYIGVDAPKRIGTEVKNLSLEKICCISSPKIFDAYLLVNCKDETERNRKFSEGINLEELSNVPLITFTSENYIRKFLDEFFETHNIHPHIICETSRHDLVLRFCEEGYGVGITYRMLLHDMLQHRDRTKIYVLPVKNFFPRQYTNLVYRKESFRPNYVKRFAEITQEIFRDYYNSVNNILEK